MGQYIGARYVPKFMGVYDPTQIYEALDVVDNSLGTSYISKIPTPAGTPLTNTTYWAIYGASSGAIVNLQNQINDMQDGTVPGSLQEQIDTNTSDITALTNNEQRNTCLYFGNSYTIGSGSTTGTDGLFALTKDMFTDAKEYVAGGLGFVTYTNHNATFEDYLDSAIADTTLDKNKVTDIMFLSAWGDSSALVEKGRATYTAELNTTLASIKAKIAAKFPNIKRVSVALVEARAKRIIYNTSIGTSYYRNPFYAHMVLNDVLRKNGIEYLGWVGFEIMMKSNYMSSDFYHPNDVGYGVLSSALRSAYNGAFEYKPLIGDMSYAVNALVNGIGGARVIQTPYETKLIFGLIRNDNGTSPTAQQVFATLADDNIEKLSPLMVDSSASHALGTMMLLMATNATSVQFNAFINSTSDGKIQLNGNPFDTGIAYTARTNSNWNIKELTIPHFTSL